MIFQPFSFPKKISFTSFFFGKTLQIQKKCLLLHCLNDNLKKEVKQCPMV